MMNSFMQQVFTEHLLCARHCCDSMDTAMEKRQKPLPFKELTF